MSRLRWVGVVALVLAVGLAAKGWLGAGSPALVASAPAPAKPREVAVVGAPPAEGDAAPPRPRDARALAERLRERGAGGPRLTLPGGMGASGAADGAGRTGVELVNRRAERVVRRADLALDDVRGLVKDEDAVAELEAIVDQLEADMTSARDRLATGQLDVPGAMGAMDAAQRAAAQRVGDVVDGEPAAVMEKVLGPVEPPSEDGWGGVPLEEWTP